MNSFDLPGVPGRPIPGPPKPSTWVVPGDDVAAGSARAKQPSRPGGGTGSGDGAHVDGRTEPQVQVPPFDPLRLCIFATVALLTWIFGPWAVLAFALLGLSGYWRAHRAGLTRSRCYLRDVRLVLAYLGTLTVAALVGIGVAVAGLVS